MSQIDNNSEAVLGAIQYSQQPTVELEGNINVSDGRIVLANGETAQLTTDPSSKLTNLLPVLIHRFHTCYTLLRNLVCIKMLMVG